MAKEWENEWIKGVRLGKGGQGLTYRAQRKIDHSDDYALKLLKEQKIDSRRERMFLEVSTLQILNNIGISKFIDYNASDYKDKAKDLYIVTEFIPGQTLQEYIDKNGPLTLSEALSLTLKICEIIE